MVDEDAGSWRNDPDIKRAAELLRKQRPLRKSSFEVAFAGAYDNVIQIQKSMLKMNYYPDLSNVEPANHLLFDIGFTYALLERTKNVLRDIAGCDDYPVAVAELLAAIEAFQAGRLRVRSDLYENAAAAAEKGMEKGME